MSSIPRAGISLRDGTSSSCPTTPRSDPVNGAKAIQIANDEWRRGDAWHLHRIRSSTNCEKRCSDVFLWHATGRESSTGQRRSSMRLRQTSCRALAASGTAAGGTRWGALKRSMRARCPIRQWMKPLPHRYFGIPIHKAFPRVFVAISAKLSDALDLTDGKVRQQLRASLSKLFGEDWRKQQDRGRESLTQAIGRAAFETGLEALLVRSAVSSNGEGLVIFPANLKTGSKLKILKASDLSK